MILSGRAGPECEGFSTNVGRWVLLATILGSSMAFIDGTVVNVALPTLQRDFSATAAGVQWVVQAYSLFLAALILVVVLLAISAITAIAFVIVEQRVSNPMVPLSLFSSRTFSGANLLTLFLYAALSGALYFFPFNLIQVQGYSSTAAGAAMLPMILLMFGLSRWAGGLVGQYGARLPLTVGPVIAGLGFLLFAIPGISGSYWTTFFPAVLLLGLGMTVTVAPLTTAVMGAVEDRYAGLASGINNAVSRAGGVIAIAAFGILVTATFARALDADLAKLDLPAAAEAEIEANRDQLAALTVPSALNTAQREAVAREVDESFVSGFRVVMIVSAVMAFASAGAAAISIGARREGSARTVTANGAPDRDSTAVRTRVSQR